MVLFDTDFPVISFERTRVEVEGFGIPAGAERTFLRDNAFRLHKIPGS